LDICSGSTSTIFIVIAIAAIGWPGSDPRSSAQIRGAVLFFCFPNYQIAKLPDAGLRPIPSAL